MSNRAVIAATTSLAFTVTLRQFEAAAAHWSPHATLGPDLDFEADAVIRVERPDEAAFHIYHSVGEDVLMTDGTAEQSAEVAVWAADSFVVSGPSELWLTDQEFTGHTVLRPGMSLDEVRAGWQKHD
jgi:hypothetical protein